MSKISNTCNTGLPGLEKILNGVRLGDNVVFQVDGIEDYIKFATPFYKSALKAKKNLIYFRFAEHQSVIPEGVCKHVYELHPEAGFENFISEIFDVIEQFGKGAFMFLIVCRRWLLTGTAIACLEISLWLPVLIFLTMTPLLILALSVMNIRLLPLMLYIIQHRL